MNKYLIIVILVPFLFGCTPTKQVHQNSSNIHKTNFLKNNLSLNKKLGNRLLELKDSIYMLDSQEDKKNLYYYYISGLMYNNNYLTNKVDSAGYEIDFNLLYKREIKSCSYIDNYLDVIFEVKNKDDGKLVLSKLYSLTTRMDGNNRCFAENSINDSLFNAFEKDISAFSKNKSPIIDTLKISKDYSNIKDITYYPKVLRIGLGLETSTGGDREFPIINSYEILFGRHIAVEIGPLFNDNYGAEFHYGVNYYFGCRDGFFIGYSHMNDYRYIENIGSIGYVSTHITKGGYYWRVNRFWGLKSYVFYNIVGGIHNLDDNYPPAEIKADNRFGVSVGLSFNI